MLPEMAIGYGQNLAMKASTELDRIKTPNWNDAALLWFNEVLDFNKTLVDAYDKYWSTYSRITELNELNMN